MLLIPVFGEAATTSDIEVFNFPNPFDLQAKNKTLSHGGATGSLDTEGTIVGLKLVTPDNH